jgi:hypothetical protein
VLALALLDGNPESTNAKGSRIELVQVPALEALLIQLNTAWPVDPEISVKLLWVLVVSSEY